jgi:hypothetical protein
MAIRVPAAAAGYSVVGMRSPPPGYAADMATNRERAVCSEPIETESGEEVVVCQQNTGPGSQVGGGEFKNVDRGKTPDEVAEEQDDLERDAATK